MSVNNGSKGLLLIALLVMQLMVQGCSMMSSSSNSPFEKIKQDAESAELAELLAGRAEAAYQSKQYKKSADLWQQVIDVDPTHIKALYRLGNTQFKLGDTMLARGFYEQTVELSPRHFKAHYNLAVINLVLAEQHFKFYAATTNPKSDLDNVTEILGEISRFKETQSKVKPTRLERLAKQLGKK